MMGSVTTFVTNRRTDEWSDRQSDSPLPPVWRVCKFFYIPQGYQFSQSLIFAVIHVRGHSSSQILVISSCHFFFSNWYLFLQSCSQNLLKSEFQENKCLNTTELQGTISQQSENKRTRRWNQTKIEQQETNRLLYEGKKTDIPVSSPAFLLCNNHARSRTH